MQTRSSKGRSYFLKNNFQFRKNELRDWKLASFKNWKHVCNLAQILNSVKKVTSTDGRLINHITIDKN